jgi:hypothetical protein
MGCSDAIGGRCSQSPRPVETLPPPACHRHDKQWRLSLTTMPAAPFSQQQKSTVEKCFRP